MNSAIFGFILGLFVGVFIGIFLMCLANAAAHRDEWEDDDE